MASIRLSVPKTASPGETIELKALIQHPMESGFRRDSSGKIIERNILKHFTCTYNGEKVFEAELFPATSANPFLSFHTVATESGELKFSWTDQHGETWSETANISVE